MVKIYTAGPLTFAGSVAVEGPAPVASVGLLLLLLAERGGSATRSAVAVALFPNSRQPMNALRQTLHRAQRWLHPGMLVAEGRLLRLTSFDIDESWPGGSLALPVDQLEGIQHPIATAWRLRRGTPTETATPTFATTFRNAVEELARLDSDAARTLLTGSAQLCFALPRAEVGHLLALTEPASPRAWHAAHHALMQANLAYRAGTMRACLGHHLRAYKIAKHVRDLPILAQAASFVMFAYLEMGAKREADLWLQKLTLSDRSEPDASLVLNAKASYYWNNAHLDPAWATMEEAFRHMPMCDRTGRIHQMSNMAVLAAERGDLYQAKRLIEEINMIKVPGFDNHFHGTSLLAEAVVAREERRYADAIDTLQEMAEHARKGEHAVMEWYADEMRAAVLGCAERFEEARILWKKAEQRRMPHCLGLNPRIAQLKAMALGTYCPSRS